MLSRDFLGIQNFTKIVSRDLFFVELRNTGERGKESSFLGHAFYIVLHFLRNESHSATKKSKTLPKT